ncbi:Bug family tripartite tricarboxylate transporter substrate binding protein [Hydrogenophaga laconesensis]|uniref:Tripartite-type tricarboxylate transporter receptor subunit TctC n=1 Tax=Hydrogenophaga laconesensis TaxID=1805971 RepID=A0ABU1VHY4_9BURK|nr:tripartite tricarboxylate transporter substrate binding protein [Hydrogenophaga laconesensis]MDR7096930.1 tripartite-type tricarboxylate transporter receptor subunit TctC [Hydrogenophaga laconesensis]
MDIQRRNLLTLAAAACAWQAFPAHSQQPGAWPAKPIRIIAPFAPGGGPDILARLFAQEMSAGLGSAFVENKAGGGGNLGADAAAKAAPDGYTLLLTTTATHSINPALYASMPYDSLKDFTPIALVANTPLMLGVAQNSPFKNVADMVAAARAQPDQISYASSGVGTMQHMAAVLAEEQARVRMLHVPYKGSSQVMPDLLAGRVNVMFNSVAAFAPFIKDGRLRPLAVTSPRRLAAWPDVLTMSEAGLPGFEASAWYAVYGPAGTPRDIVLRLNREIHRIVDLPTSREKYAALGLEAVRSTPEDLAAATRDDLAKWTRIIREKNIKAE